MNTSPTVRMNISLPLDMVRELKRYTPARGVSRFLVESAREKIARIERKKALVELLRAPSSFTNIANAATYVRRSRRRDERRTKRLGV